MYTKRWSSQAAAVQPPAVPAPARELQRERARATTHQPHRTPARAITPTIPATPAAPSSMAQMRDKNGTGGLVPVPQELNKRLISCLPDGAAPLTQISLMTDLGLMSQEHFRVLRRSEDWL